MISDQIMPGMKGHELLAEVNKLYPDIVQILLTGQASIDDIAKTINNTNLYRYIAKPWQKEDLNMTVSEAIKSYNLNQKVDGYRIAIELHNQELEQKVLDRTREIDLQKNLILEKSKQITSSINYAKYIQDSIQPDRKLLKTILPSSFIFSQPRDIVSGDFYWFKNIGSKLIITVADCTGHGIPGAFISMVGVCLLEQIVNQRKIFKAGEILNELSHGVQMTLNQGTSNAKDGMDISLCVLDFETNELEFSGAYNPLFIVSKEGEINILQGNRKSIGDPLYVDSNFKTHKGPLNKGDKYFLFSDGFQDQFGGVYGKKFLRKRFYSILAENAHLPFDKQKTLLSEVLNEWMGNEYDQVDDILIIGFEVC